MFTRPYQNTINYRVWLSA